MECDALVDNALPNILVCACVCVCVIQERRPLPIVLAPAVRGCTENKRLLKRYSFPLLSSADRCEIVITETMSDTISDIKSKVPGTAESDRQEGQDKAKGGMEGAFDKAKELSQQAMDTVHDKASDMYQGASERAQELKGNVSKKFRW